MTEFICLDIETTGLDQYQDNIIEFAAARFNETEILEQYQTFVRYEGEISPIIEHLTGIDSSMVKDAPTIAELKDKILDFCGNLPIMGHNIQFDLGFLHQFDVPVPGFKIDTMPLAQSFVESQSYSLETLCRNFNSEYQPTHRALDDVLANIELFQSFLKQIKNFSPEQTYLWNQILSKTDTPYAKTFLQLLNKDSQKPEFVAINTPDSDEEILTPEISEATHIEAQITSKGPETLFVLDENTQPIGTTILPKYMSQIDPELFMKVIQNQSEFSEPEMHFLLKVATKIPHQTPLYSTDLNLHNNDYQFLNKILSDNYLIPKSDKPYHTNHYNFFKLFREGQLPNFQEIHFEHNPFLEEIFVRSQTFNLNLHQAENGTENNDLTFAFAELGKYGQRLQDEQNSWNNQVELSIFDLTSEEILNFLFTLKRHSTNEHIQNGAALLKSNSSKYLAWINLSNHEAPSLSFVEKGIHEQLPDTLQQISCQKLFTYHPSKEDHPFFLNIKHGTVEPNAEGHLEQIVGHIYDELKDIDKQGLIISTSKAQITELHKLLAKEFDNLGITLLSQYVSGSKGKILDKISNNEGPHILLCTHHFLIRNHPELTRLQKAIMTKIPMSLPHHQYYSWLKKETDNDFNKLTIPYTASVLYQICQTINKQNNNINSLQMLDVRLDNTHWGQDIVRYLPENITAS